VSVRAADMRFAEILDGAIADSGKLDALVERHGGEAGVFAHMRATLNVHEDDDEAILLESFCAELRLERPQCESVTAWFASGACSHKSQTENLSAFLTGGMTPEYFRRLRTVFNTVQDEPRSSLAKAKAIKANPALSTYLHDLCDRVAAVDARRK